MSVHSGITIEITTAVSSLGTMPDLRGTVPEADLFLDFFLFFLHGSGEVWMKNSEAECIWLNENL